MSCLPQLPSYCDIILQNMLPARTTDKDTRLQVLSPMKKGQAGTRRLNRRLQALLNPPDNSKAEAPLRTWSAEERGVLRVGDRVIQVCTECLVIQAGCCACFFRRSTN